MKTLKLLILIQIALALLIPIKPRILHGGILKGNRFYNSGNYSEALKYYKMSITNLKGNEKGIVMFNIGDTLYKIGDYQSSIKYYDSAKKFLKSKKKLAYTFFNTGNAYYRLGKFEKAVDEYRVALKLLPYRKDIKENLYIALKKLEESKQKKLQSQSNLKKSEQFSNNRNTESKNHSKSIGSETPSPQKTDKVPGNKNQSEKGESYRKNDIPRPLTPEEALKILESLEQYHKRQIEELIKYRFEKDKEDENKVGW